MLVTIVGWFAKQWATYVTDSGYIVEMLTRSTLMKTILIISWQWFNRGIVVAAEIQQPTQNDDH
jgi:hypothetical protein